MTMIGQVSNLWPRDQNQEALPPFSDSSVNGVRYTGKHQFSSSGCGKYSAGMAYCQERWQRTQYRALTHARLDFTKDTKTLYATTAMPQITPGEATLSRTRFKSLGWGTFEGTLP